MRDDFSLEKRNEINKCVVCLAMFCPFDSRHLSGSIVKTWFDMVGNYDLLLKRQNVTKSPYIQEAHQTSSFPLGTLTLNKLTLNICSLHAPYCILSERFQWIISAVAKCIGLLIYLACAKRNFVTSRLATHHFTVCSQNWIVLWLKCQSARRQQSWNVYRSTDSLEMACN